MSLALEIIGGYLIVAPVWARGQSVRLQKRIKIAREHEKRWEAKYGRARGSSQIRQLKKHNPWFAHTKTWEHDLKLGVSLHGIFWPTSLLSRLGTGVIAWTIKPVTREKEAAEKLREEANSYTPVLDNPNTTESERELINRLVSSLKAQAKEREL